MAAEKARSKGTPEVFEPAPEPVPVPVFTPAPESGPVNPAVAVSRPWDSGDGVKLGFVIAPSLIYGKIDATDNSNGAKGNVPSDPAFGCDLKFVQAWSNDLTSELIVQLNDIKYNTNSGRVFNDNGGFMFNVGAGVGWRPFGGEFSNRLKLKADILFGDEFYFRAPTVTSLAIDNARTVKGDLTVDFDITTYKYAALGIGAGGRFIAPATIDVSGAAYDTKTGYGYFGLLYVRQHLRHVTFEESFTYVNLYKDTDLFNQTQAFVSLKVGATFLFGGISFK